ncbi:MAG: hypothetical protein JJU37_10400 [Balneolaceae bacterium]|nr:hypothetical protein [Balneolaceae bacterium]
MINKRIPKLIPFLSAILIAIFVSLTGCSTDSQSYDFILTIEIIPEGSGTTDPLPGGFDEGENLRLRAIPDENYLFDRWEGDLTTVSNPADLTMNSDKFITAIFSRAPLTMGGDGSEANPYHVHSLADLVAIGLEDNLDKHFIQMQDIDASPSADFQDGSGFRHIGTQEAPFTGSFNGNGYKIIDLKIHFNRFDKHIGLFGYIKEATLENIYVDNSRQLADSQTDHQSTYNLILNQTNVLPSYEIDIFGSQSAGGLVGFNEDGIVRNSFFNGVVVLQSGYVAGLVGINTGIIEKLHFIGRAGNLGTTAGLVGINTGKVVDSSSGGRISGQLAAGLVARNIGGEILQSSTIATVHSSTAIGGLVFYNSGVIRSSFSKNNDIYDATGAIGGLVARNNGEIIDSYSITELESFFDPNRDIIIGGLVGENLENGSIQTSFAAGYILPLEQSILGGLAGKNSGVLMNVYWDTDSTGQAIAVDQGNPEGATGLTTDQLTGPAAEQNMPEFDWVNVWRTTADGYPVLRWEDE